MPVETSVFTDLLHLPARSAGVSVSTDTWAVAAAPAGRMYVKRHAVERDYATANSVRPATEAVRA